MIELDERLPRVTLARPLGVGFRFASTTRRVRQVAEVGVLPSSACRMARMDALSGLFARQPRPLDGGDWWVSKTDVVQYHRCPWAFWMMDSGQLRHDEVLEEVPALRSFIDQGIAFESEVHASVTAIPEGQVPTLAEHGSSVIFGVPMIRNTVLGIHGAPDAVTVERGTLAPVEVKSHRRPTVSDQIELCFYWDLLAPWRTQLPSLVVPDRPDPPPILTVAPLPQGYLVLPDGEGGWRMEHIWLREKRFEQMRLLVAGVRQARREPPPQRICACPVCSRLFRDRIEEHAYMRGDLTLVSGIGRHRALVLETAGIPDVAALQTANPVDIVTRFRAAGGGVPSEREVERWIHHAIALTSNETVVFGSNPFAHTDYIALDLEYDSDPVTRAVYLAGVMVVSEAGMEPCSFWADPGDEAALLTNLAGLLVRHPKVPVVTWNGEAADGIELQKACSRSGMHGLWEEFRSRHVDLYRYLLESVRFPVHGLDLKSLGGYLGIASDKSVVDGMGTVALWRRYRNAPGSDEAIALRRDLVQYNAQDVTTLVSLAEFVRDLTVERHKPVS